MGTLSTTFETLTKPAFSSGSCNWSAARKVMPNFLTAISARSKNFASAESSGSVPSSETALPSNSCSSTQPPGFKFLDYSVRSCSFHGAAKLPIPYSSARFCWQLTHRSCQAGGPCASSMGLCIEDEPNRSRFRSAIHLQCRQE